MPRFLKQLFYGFLYIIIFIGIPIGIYYVFLKPAPNCFDGAQNGNEAGVDCGGTCAAVCIPFTLKPLDVPAGVKVLPVDRGRVSVLAEVVNPNPDFAAQSVRYRIHLKNSIDEDVRALEGVSYLYGGEVKLIAVPNVSVGNVSIASAAIEFGDVAWVAAAEMARPRIRVQHVTTHRDLLDGGSQIFVEGELVNDDVVAFPSIEAIAIFRGKFGEIVGVSRTEISGVNPASARAFTVAHPDIQDADLSATSVTLAAIRQ